MTAVAMAPGEVMTRAEAAAFLRVHVVVVSRYIRERGLPAHKIGRDWRLLRSEVIAWVASKGTT